MFTALASESGPCYVNEAGNGTILNPWSFNEHVNMLYIDQPVQVGFSYDSLYNGTFNLTSEVITPLEYNSSSAASAVDPLTSWGTFPSQNPLTTTNTTVSSAVAGWHFAEHWLSSFPPYSTSSNKVSFWGNSYGGFWAPEYAVRFSKNFKSLPAKHPLKSKKLVVDTLGITNGCLDFAAGTLIGWPEYYYNNTYGVHFLSEDQYNLVVDNITTPGGVVDLINQCRALGLAGDPMFLGNNETVNEACQLSFVQSEGVLLSSPALNNVCITSILSSLKRIANASQRSGFDIAVHQPDPCVFDIAVTNYLNRADVQQSLGVPLNFTYDSTLVAAVFGNETPYPYSGTGDGARQAGVPNLEYLLANGVKIAFAYGDRDARCPWTGAENSVRLAKWAHQKGFASAGYTNIQGIKTGHQGVVKQYGLLSFARIFDAGHAVSAYAPEAVYRVFQRAMLGKDIATGTQQAVGKDYHTKGPTTSWGWRNTLPADVPHTCMVEGQWTATNPWEPLLGPQ